jgi:acyl-CoA thioesterase-1
MRLGLRVFGICAMALASACGGAAEDAAPRPADSAAPAISRGDTGAGSGAAAPAADRPAVLFIGTSLTAGYGLDDPAREAYPAVLQRLADSAGLNVEMVNAGYSGETSAGALRRVAWLLDRYGARTRVAVVETGANDGLRALDPDTMRSNIDAIVRLVQQRLPDAQVLLVQM